MVNKKMWAVTAAASLVIQAFALVAIVTALAGSGSGAPSGAVFTTDEDGTRVNQNIYDDKRDVYIDGGPGPNAPQTSAGLDDGNYYFQVTGTDGKTLFSSDPVKCREFRVRDGIIVDYVSANRTFVVPGGARFCHLDGKQLGRHDTGTDSDHNAVTIQLMPFNNTSNPGGVYKVWVTPTDQFQGNASNVDNPCSSGCEHGFLHSQSKTDNFKVKVSTSFVAPTLTVKKFDDLNGNGAWDSGEPEVGVDEKIGGGGWPVAVVDPSGAASYGYTRYTYYTGFAGNYTVLEGTNNGWVQTALIVDGTAKTVNATAKVKVDYTDGETHTVVYGNFHGFTVSGAKVNDTDGDGVRDSNEGTLSGWSIQLYRNGNLYASATTDSDGKYSFSLSQGGSFVVKEVNKNGWTQTGASDYSFTGKSGVSRQGLDFTNHMNSSNSAPGCVLLCITLNLPVSVSLDLTASLDAAVATDVSAFVVSCAQVIADVEASVTATVAVDIDTGVGCASSCSNPCETGCAPPPCSTGCGSDTGVSVEVNVSADVSNSCTSNCGSSPPPCQTSCESTPPPCETSCESTPPCSCDTTTETTTDVSVDVSVDVGAGSSCGSSCASSCQTSCSPPPPCGCETSSDATADVSADVSAVVDVGVGGCGCDSTSVDVGADLGVDVAVGTGAGVGLTL